jgi:N-sulfoglucosamine sulfohydrolase
MTPFSRHFGLALLAGLTLACSTISTHAAAPRPNVLVFITDDQAFPYASAYGSRLVRTPAFDRVAREGALFTQAFAASPGCSPSRAAFLTGRHPWQLREAGTHSSSFPADLPVLPDVLEAAGYAVGTTGKGWGPGDWKISGRKRNPAGPAFVGHEAATPPPGADKRDYTANFRDFLATVPAEQPFFFWLGTTEPHAPFSPASLGGPSEADVAASIPEFLPDRPAVREDLRAYAAEIELADRHLAATLHALEMAGRLDNTLVIVTSDNGIPLPRGKANLYDAGTRVPLAIRWPAGVAPGRTLEHVVSLLDITHTIYTATGVTPPPGLVGRDLTPVLRTAAISLPTDGAVFTARERHSYARKDNLGYPARAVRTDRYLYIRNYAPDRWPAGDPQGAEKSAYGFYDIDETATKALFCTPQTSNDPVLDRFRELALGLRPAEELYDTAVDPGNLHNLATDSAHEGTLATLRNRLQAEQQRTGDLRLTNPSAAEVWETFPRYGKMRDLN